MILLREVKSADDYQIAVTLFKEYASQLGVDLEFQNFTDEIETIEQHYARPKGAIFVAYDEKSIPMGCFGIRALKPSICELKRMYLKKEARGNGIGKLLLSKSVSVAKDLGYQKMRLDTLPTMHSAIALYQKMGFYEIESYRYNPIPETKYFEFSLEQ